MVTTCIDCGIKIPTGSGGRCWEHKNPARRYRSTAEWQQISHRVRSSGVCANCGGMFAPEDLEAHHVEPQATRAEPGGPVIPLCKSCHRIQTNRDLRHSADERKAAILDTRNQTQERTR